MNSVRVGDEKEGILLVLHYKKGGYEQMKSNLEAAVILLTLIIFSSLAVAQEAGTVINSDPPGAAITLDGEYKISATTPCRLPDDVTGKFALRASMPGYESWKGDIVIIPGQANNFTLDLSAKTRVKAAIRSVFLPGWGQYYSGNKSSGFFLNTLTLGMGIGTIVAQFDFRNKRNDYDRAKLDLQNASTYDEIERLRQVVQDKNRDAYDAETARNTLFYITAGLWAYNVLDAVIFFPETRLYFNQPGIPVKQAGISPLYDGNVVGLKFSASF